MLYNMKNKDAMAIYWHGNLLAWHSTSLSIYKQLVRKQYKKAVDGKFDDVTVTTLGSSDSSEEESCEEEAPGEKVDLTASGEKEETV